jgi:hypothetical protein
LKILLALTQVQNMKKLTRGIAMWENLHFFN